MVQNILINICQATPSSEFKSLLITTILVFTIIVLFQWFKITKLKKRLLNNKESHFQAAEEKFSLSTEQPSLIADITVQKNIVHKNIEHELDEQTRFLNNIIDNIPQSIFWKDLNSKYLGCNINFAEYLGLEKPSDIIGKSDKDVNPKHELVDTAGDREVIKLGKGYLNREQQRTTAGGIQKTFLISKVPLKDSKGSITGIVGMFTDITDRKLIKELLHQSQKMDSIGQLAGGVAHDFNNMLGGIIGASELLGLKLKESPELMIYINMIKESSKRAAELTLQLLEFSRKETASSNPMDVHDSIGRAIDILYRSIDKIIVIDQQLTAEHAIINGDLAQIQNAILNLALNARDAMPEGGTLTFSTRNINLSEESCEKYNYDTQPGPHIVIEIKDTGQGIPQEIIKHIFDPFFTTKETSKGTGLGLATVYTTIKNHHGIIEVISEPDSGSIFTLYLPVLESELDKKDETDQIISGNGTILVIDDEPIVRLVTAEILKDLGYQVVTANDGIEGVKKYQDNSIDLVLLDMIMPNMNGSDCFNKIKELDQEAKIIAISGFSRDIIMKELYENGLLDFITKPINRAVLSKAIDKSLK